MKIGIIGAGNIGFTIAKLFTQAGHEVALSNSRGPASLQEQIRELGPKARALSAEESAAFGEIILLAVPWRSPEALPSPEAVKGKIVIDAMNPYKADFSLYDLGNSTSSEETGKRLPEARLVKAFNTIWFKHLATKGNPSLPLQERHAIYIAGDDEEAKAIIARLIEDIGFAPIDTGTLREGGKLQQPDTELYNGVRNGAEAQAIVNQLKQPAK